MMSPRPLTANAFTRSGHTLLGWSVSRTATTATYANSQSLSNLTATNAATVNFYAVWTAATSVPHSSISLSIGGYSTAALKSNGTVWTGEKIPLASLETELSSIVRGS
ncbi:MAG: hypothetical protein FWC60_01500 [Firmicutes bacterium]|nr:hypothetical protein [Bacillota bacterium]